MSCLNIVLAPLHVDCTESQLDLGLGPSILLAQNTSSTACGISCVTTNLFNLFAKITLFFGKNPASYYMDLVCVPVKQIASAVWQLVVTVRGSTALMCQKKKISVRKRICFSIIFVMLYCHFSSFILMNLFT